MYFITYIAGSVVLAITIYHFLGVQRIRRNGQLLRRPPNTLPLVGNGLLFLQARHKLFSWFVTCEQIFGFETFEISVPSLPPGVVINDPENLEFVLKNEAIFSKGRFFKQRSWDLFGMSMLAGAKVGYIQVKLLLGTKLTSNYSGNGIINADGELWKIQRKAGLDFLNKRNLDILTTVALPKYMNSTTMYLKSKPDSDVVDLESVFHELTTQLMGRMAYDMDMHAADSFSRAFEYASGATGERFQNPLWQITEVLSRDHLRKALDEVKRFGKEIVANAVEARHMKEGDKRRETRTSDTTILGSLIYSLLDTISDHQVVADAALNYLSAGRDTTAQALTWTFYLLMRHPRVIDNLRDESSSICKYDQYGSLSLEPSALQPAVLPYTMAVFYESLRLYPPVPFELKQCEKSTTLPDGTFLPASAIVVWCTWAMNRSQLIWGDDADLFRPERWLDNGKLVTRTAYEFPVFNGGPRTCLGKKMAECMAVMVIADLVLKFDFVLVDANDRTSRNSLTLPMEGGLPCYVTQRRQMKGERQTD